MKRDPGNHNRECGDRRWERGQGALQGEEIRDPGNPNREYGILNW